MVNVDAVLGQVETTKATIDIVSTANGYFYPRVEIGEILPVGNLFGHVLDNEDPIFLETKNEKPWDRAQLLVSDAARALLDKHGLALDNFSNNQALRAEDVVQYLGLINKKAMSNDFVAKINSVPNPLIIYGAGRHGLVVYDAVIAGGEYTPVLLVDDSPDLDDGFYDLPILSLDQLEQVVFETVPFFHIAIGAVPLAKEARKKCQDLGFASAKVIHPMAYVSPLAEVGEGVFIGPQTVVGPKVVIGDMVHVNNGATIAHHCSVGCYARISDGAHLGGAVSVGEGTLIGIGCAINKDIVIGCNCTVVSGVTVFDNLEDNIVLRSDGTLYYSRQSD
ncbi:hypothetical protein [Kiloniella laminariae]|uniref:PglD-related sugar-binding protein n=1 Tax=Kiloniella laminariae TaxID=454162 RepID=UPI0012FAEAFB|nr:hypothetical protein [Kiloniella laminariae]